MCRDNLMIFLLSVKEDEKVAGSVAERATGLRRDTCHMWISRASRRIGGKLSPSLDFSK